MKALNRSSEPPAKIFYAMTAEYYSTIQLLYHHIMVFNVSVSCKTNGGTVNSEIFEKVLFSRNFAYAKFRETKILAKWRNHSVVY